jgi:hypothetical protein
MISTTFFGGNSLLEPLVQAADATSPVSSLKIKEKILKQKKTLDDLSQKKRVFIKKI